MARSSIAGTAAWLALALAAPAAQAQQPRRKMTAFAADLTPAFEYLQARGIVHQEGLRAAYGNVEAMFRPVPAEAAAKLVPFGFDNIHIPWAMRGAEVPAARRRPGMQLGARYIDLGEGDSEKLMNACVIVHELAHAEYAYWKSLVREPTGRLATQLELNRRLARHIVEHQGISRVKWPSLQANEMVAYYIESSVREITERVFTLFFVNQLRARRLESAAARAALVDAQGRERLVASADDPVVKRIWEHPPWLVGGTRGDAYFEGEPIDAEIPEEWRREFYRNVLGLQLPETGDAILALANQLEGPWADAQRAKLKQLRDARVEELAQQAGDTQAAPDADDLAGGAAGGESAASAGAPVDAEGAAVMARVQAGQGLTSPLPSLLRHAGAAPPPR